jgi:hypothetical protein
LLDQFDLAARRLTARRRFLVERVKNVCRRGIEYSVHRAKRVTSKSPRDFQNTRAVKAFERVCVAMFAAALAMYKA